MFEIGQRVQLKSEVVVVGAYKESQDWLYRVKFVDSDWSFIVSEKELKKKSICENAPFVKCNNAEACETCQFNEEN